MQKVALLNFDESTETQIRLSLNDILLRFNFVISANIKKIYCQINVIEKHRDFQRLL